jgi:hypothetical protein
LKEQEDAIAKIFQTFKHKRKLYERLKTALWNGGTLFNSYLHGQNTSPKDVKWKYPKALTG